MKSKKTFVAILLLLSFYTDLCRAEGFTAGTLTKVSGGYKKIEDVRVGDYVICCDEKHNLVESSVTYIAQQSVSQHVRICVGDEWICVACDQRLYDVQSDSWIAVSDLKDGDASSYDITQLCLVDKTIDVYVVGVADHHNFFVTQRDICVHNFVPVVVVAISAAFGSGAIEIAGVSAGIAGLGTFLGYQWHKKNKKHNLVMQQQHCGGGMMPEDPEEDKKRKRDEAREKYKSLNDQEARELAKKMGFKLDKNPPFRSHGKLVFRKGNTYISADRTGHRGGIWKVFRRGEGRLGTWNVDLTKRVGD